VTLHRLAPYPIVLHPTGYPNKLQDKRSAPQEHVCRSIDLDSPPNKHRSPHVVRTHMANAGYGLSAGSPLARRSTGWFITAWPPHRRTIIFSVVWQSQSAGFSIML
jgi:hypothetical protein